jgi:hypothetical protein
VTNRLVTDAGARVRTEPTGAQVIIECGLVPRSTGYRGFPVIGTNKDACDTIAHIPEDARSGRSRRPEPGLADPTSVDAWLGKRAPDVLSRVGWEVIDAHESPSGLPRGRPRLKLVLSGGFAEAARRSGRSPIV